MAVSTRGIVLLSDSLGLSIMLTFEYVVVGIPPSVTEGIPLAPLLN